MSLFRLWETEDSLRRHAVLGAVATACLVLVAIALAVQVDTEVAVVRAERVQRSAPIVLTDPAYLASLPGPDQRLDQPAIPSLDMSNSDEVVGRSTKVDSSEEAVPGPDQVLGRSITADSITLSLPGPDQALSPDTLAPTSVPPTAVPPTSVPPTATPVPPTVTPVPPAPTAVPTPEPPPPPTAVPVVPTATPAPVPAPPAPTVVPAPPPVAAPTVAPATAPAIVGSTAARSGPAGVINQIPSSAWRWLDSYGWRVEWRQGPGPGRISEAQYATSTIVIWYDTTRSDTIWAGAFAHELGHAVSYMHFSNQQMTDWNRLRGVSSWRWVPGTPNDFSVGEGDFAEAFMSYLLGHQVRSVGGPLSQADRAWIAANTPF